MRAAYLKTRENIRRHKPKSFFHFIVVSIFSIFSVPYSGHTIPHSFRLFQLRFFLFPQNSGSVLYDHIYIWQQNFQFPRPPQLQQIIYNSQ